MPGLDVSTGVPQQTHQRAQPRRLRAWTAAALGDVAYTAAVLVWSIAGFTILVTGVAVTASLLVLVVGIPVWIGFAYLLRWTTAVDRRLAGWQRHETVTANYLRPETRGFVAFLRTLTLDPRTWKDLAWVAMNSVIGFVSRLAVVTAAGLVLTYVTIRLRRWSGLSPSAARASAPRRQGFRPL